MKIDSVQQVYWDMPTVDQGILPLSNVFEDLK
jgi:hypothetical protein